MSFRESDVQQLTQSIWSSLLGLDVEPTEWVVAPGARPMLTCRVEITGAWRGVVVLDCAAELARRAATVMFGVEAHALTAEHVQDALGELANITGGNLKALLPAPAYLSLPAVGAGPAPGGPLPEGLPLSRAAFACEDHLFCVTVVKRSGSG
jgi:hypothetical protein